MKKVKIFSPRRPDIGYRMGVRDVSPILKTCSSNCEHGGFRLLGLAVFQTAKARISIGKLSEFHEALVFIVPIFAPLERIERSELASLDHYPMQEGLEALQNLSRPSRNFSSEAFHYLYVSTYNNFTHHIFFCSSSSHAK